MGCGASKPSSENESTPSLPNVVVFGHSGGGVSSVVNLIAGKAVATVSRDASRCTESVQSYLVDVGDSGRPRSINLYDIPGFNEKGAEFVPFPSVPISLAIICMQDLRNQVRVTANYLKNKWSEHGDIPILIVINHMTPSPDAGWWGDNKKHFANLAALKDHVCLTRNKDNGLHELIMQHLPSS
ncbi:hypothetical protein BDN67DRAFT_963740 [Paxillus ammoniavirescens]|nr:hypothetical protein BDN67DRAFT_963740 [Paxillus ammoniavirescens]